MNRLKRLIALLLSIVVLSTLSVQMVVAEDTMQYSVPEVSYIIEAESAELNSNRSIKEDTIASNNSYLHIKENNASVTFTIPSDVEAGTYTVVVTAKHPYGYKENYVNLNGTRIGTIIGDKSSWEEYYFGGQTINPNDTIEIELYWGWFDVDSIKLIKTDTASEIISSYKIEAERMELNDSYDIIDTSSGSNGKCVRAYQYTDFKFTVPENFEEGLYDITVVVRFPYGYKKNYLYVNEKYVGRIEGENSTWTKYIFERNKVKANDVVELQMDWGWFDVDYIEITPSVVDRTYTYEAETAQVTDDATIVEDTTASGSGYLKVEQGTTVKFTLPEEFESGTYDLTLTAKYPFGYKKNYINLNGNNIATIEGSTSEWTKHIVSDQTLTGGDEITITMEWGYFDIDSLTISTGYHKVELDSNIFEYYEELDTYFTEENITSISGTLNCYNVESMNYRLVDGDNNKISSGDLSVSSNWITPIELVYGYNTFTTTVICSNNKVYIRNFTIYYGETTNVDQNDDDGDGFLNYLEDYFGTDKNNKDCDNDGITDYEEIFIFDYSPVNADSDGNGITDGNEDYDSDGITNADELRIYNTNAENIDTDSDGLTDYDEIFVYFTNPNKEDTDGDTLTDGEEVKLGLDPNLADSNNNGVPDNEEKIYQVYTPELEFDEESPITEMSLSFAGTGDITSQTTVTDMMDVDVLSSNVVGLVGAPYEIETTSSFDEATITFTVDQTKLGDTQFADLGVLWYDEENDEYVEINSTLDEMNYTVSAVVPHFSEYMVVDLSEWHERMKNYRFNLNKTSRYELFNDQVTWEQAKILCLSKGGHLATITSYEEQLKIENLISNNPGDYWLGAKYSHSQYTYDDTYWIWDNNDEWTYSNWGDTQAYLPPITPPYNYCIVSAIHGLISSDKKWYKISDIVDSRNGTPYMLGCGYICEWDNETVDITDLDGDGLPDYYEVNGMIAQNGQDIITSTDNSDCDEDGLSDGEEVSLVENSDGTYSFKMKADPVLVDCDYDGIADEEDDKPLNNGFTGKIALKEYTENEIKYSVDFKVDYRNFFTNNEKYNKDLSVLGSIFATLAYKGTHLSLNSPDTIGDIRVIYNIFGLNDYKDYKLADYYTDDDISEISIGHRLVNYCGVSKEIIVVSVRGTDSTIEEWSSNFDVGADTVDYLNINNNSYWRNKSNHKGFDVAANRIYDYINDYVKSYIDDETQKTIYIVGHSRGAAIANILGAKFEDANDYQSFVYTYASPNTTTSNNAYSYKTIFNIVNEDDMITYLPLTTWNFKKYGTTYSLSVKDEYEDKFLWYNRYTWEWLFGEDYNYNGYLSETIEEFNKIANNREQLYTYTNDSNIIYTYNGNYTDAQYAINYRKNKYGERFNRYCQVYAVHSGQMYLDRYSCPIDVFSVNVKQTPAFLMMNIADIVAESWHIEDSNGNDIIDTETYVQQGKGEDKLFSKNLSFFVADKYKKAKSAFCHSGAEVMRLGGIEDAHMQGTYYFIAKDYKNILDT